MELDTATSKTDHLMDRRNLRMTKSIEEYVERQEPMCRENDAIDRRLYDEYGVNCGLRDENGNGVLTGLTNIS